jgi:hypothetical protein
MKCKACERPARKGGLCAYHARAFAALKKGYDAWNKAYSGISWEGYLKRVKDAEGTGRWVKEVITVEESGKSLD